MCGSLKHHLLEDVMWKDDVIGPPREGVLFETLIGSRGLLQGLQGSSQVCYKLSMRPLMVLLRPLT